MSAHEEPAALSLLSLTGEEGDLVLERFQAIRPFLEEHISLTETAKQANISLSTLKRWIDRYRTDGLAGLSRKTRIDNNVKKFSSEFIAMIEGLALKKPRLSAAAIYRKMCDIAKLKKEVPPSYSTVYSIITKISPSLMMLAHEGTLVYNDTYDLLHRREADGPNAIWQADHTLLNIYVLDDKNIPRKPLLTAIIDDYSRTIAGYFLTFDAPSALNTALVLRQAIWRKPRPDWQICGIPQVLYTDHGCDFTSKRIEQVAADLKIQLIFSTVAKPRGRGKIESFFKTVKQVFSPQIPGYAPEPEGKKAKASLTLQQVSDALEKFIIEEYNSTPHSQTGEVPQVRWSKNAFLPQMPASLEQLDLLLLTVPTSRFVQQDGIRFKGFRYISPVLSAYVREQVILRYDPRDMAEIRIYHEDKFLCRAICQELAGGTVTLLEITAARKKHYNQLRHTLKEKINAAEMAESLLAARRWEPPPSSLKEEQETEIKKNKAISDKPKIKRYFYE